MKVAAVQMDVRILERDYNLERALEFLEAAARAGACVVVFPECVLTGYCFSSLAEAWPVAETVPGPSTMKLAEATRRLDCSAVIGLLEREGDRIYNAAAVVGPEAILGTYRKVHLLHLGIDRFNTAGDKPFQVFEAEHARIGVNICFDVSIPEAARVLKLNGAQLLAVPTNWPVASDSWRHVPPVRALENHFFVVAADRVGEERGFRFAGHSQIVDPGGQVLAEAGGEEETIIYAEVDLASADCNRVIRISGEYEFDRIAARRPEFYGPLTAPRSR